MLFIIVCNLTWLLFCSWSNGFELHAVIRQACEFQNKCRALKPITPPHPPPYRERYREKGDKRQRPFPRPVHSKSLLFAFCNEICNICCSKMRHGMNRFCFLILHFPHSHIVHSSIVILISRTCKKERQEEPEKRPLELR